jgi:ABC-type antimicrobial peptide transport system permease subunit
VALGLAAISVVAALSMEATFDRSREIRAASAREAPAPEMPLGGFAFATVPPTADEDRLRPLVYSLTGVLVVIGIASVAATSLLSFRERRAEVGVLKAIGLTPRDVVFAATSGGIALLRMSRRADLRRRPRCRRRSQ